jgi:lipid II:glycine glycyltransferase (peptidoglycan interpeptide bridge formation enzyme)
LFLKISSGGRVIGAASVRLKTIPFFSRGIAYVSAGPLTRTNSTDPWDETRMRAVLGAMKRKLVDEQGHILRLRLPLLPPMPTFNFGQMFADLGFQPTSRSRAYRTLMINLKREPEELRKNLNGKWRTRLNSATKAGLSVDIGTDANIFSRFQRLFDQMHGRKKFPIHVHPSFLFDLGSKCTGLVVMIARKNDKDAAGHVLSIVGESAIYLFGATNDLGRETKAAYFLNWSAMLHAKLQGAAWYDLGGIDPHANPSVYEFKSRMGGQEMLAIGPYETRPGGLLGFAIDKLELVRGVSKKIRNAGN